MLVYDGRLRFFLALPYPTLPLCCENNAKPCPWGKDSVCTCLGDGDHASGAGTFSAPVRVQNKVVGWW